MLQVIRDRVQGVIVWAIVGLIILTFAVWGINNYFEGDRGVQVATVNGEDISQHEYQLALQQERNRMQRILGPNFDPDLFENQLKTSALERVIESRLLIEAADKSGFRISDQQLSQQIRSFEPFQQDGTFSKALYEQQLRAQGEGPASFEVRIRRSMLTEQVVRGVTTTNFATPREIDDRYHLEQQRRTFGYFTVPLEEFKKGIEIDDAAVKQYYESNRDRYQTPERVSIDYIELSAQQLADKIDVPESEAQKYYEEEKSRFAEPEERRAGHILIEVPQNANDEQWAAAKEEAQALYERIQKGESFAELAKKYSKDPGSASKGGDLGFFGRGIMDEAFENAAFNLKVGEVSQPVRSAFGYHIIKLNDIHPEKIKPYAEVKDQLKAELRRQKAEVEYFELTETLANQSFEHPDTLQPAAEELGVAVKSSAWFTRDGGAGIASNPKVVEAAFSPEVLDERLNSEPIEVGSNHTVVVRVKDYQSASTRPLEQVREAIVNELRNQKARDKAREKGEALVGEVEQGKSGASVAKANGYKWQSLDSVKRDESGQNPEVIRQVFRMASPAQGKASVDGFSLSAGDYVVAQLFEVHAGNPDEMDKAARDAAKNDIAGMYSIGEFQALMQSLKDNAKIKRFPNNL